MPALDRAAARLRKGHVADDGFDEESIGSWNMFLNIVEPGHRALAAISLPQSIARLEKIWPNPDETAVVFAPTFFEGTTLTRLFVLATLAAGHGWAATSPANRDATIYQSSRLLLDKLATWTANGPPPEDELLALAAPAGDMQRRRAVKVFDEVLASIPDDATTVAQWLMADMFVGA
jgi:hypothetical protein